jgi:uncharacterized protein YcbK (DUF882 family)
VLRFKAENGPRYQRRLITEFETKIDFRLRALLRNLQDYMFDRFAKNLVVTCLIRTPEENRMVGGVPYSSHLSGRAADIRSWGMSKGQIGEIKAYLEHVWGPLVYVLHHDSGHGEHIHVNINYRYSIEEFA